MVNCPEKFIAKIQAVFPVGHKMYIDSQKILGGGQQILAKISTIFIIYVYHAIHQKKAYILDLCLMQKYFVNMHN